MPDRWKPNVTVAAIVQRHDRFLLVEEHTRDGLRLNTPAAFAQMYGMHPKAVERQLARAAQLQNL